MTPAPWLLAILINGTLSIAPVWNADLCAAARERVTHELGATATCLMVGVDQYTLAPRKGGVQ